MPISHLVLGTKENLLRILPLLILLSSSCQSQQLVYYRGSQVKILSQRVDKTTIRYIRTGITQEVYSSGLSFSD